MKRIKYLISCGLMALCLFPVLSVRGQDGPRTREIKRDTTEITWRNKRMIIISDGETRHIEITNNEEGDASGPGNAGEWNPETYDYTHKETRRFKKTDVDFLGLDLGFTNFIQNGVYGSEAAPRGLELKDFRPASHIALHFLPTRISLIGRGKVSLKTAFTIDWNHFHFEDNITLKEHDAYLGMDTTGITFSQNKLVSRYAMVPVLLSFNTHPEEKKKNVAISLGVFGGILWGARTKQVSPENGKVKLRGDFHLNPTKYGLTARVDYRWFDFYVNYTLSSLFEEAQGPDAQVLVAGINFIDF